MLPFTLASEPAHLNGMHGKFELPSLLMLLIRRRMTGRLTIGSQAHVRAVSVAMGVISSVSSDAEDEQFGTRLLERENLTNQAKLAAQECAQKEKIRFGAAMVKLKLIDSMRLSELLAEQHAFVLRQCLLENETETHFDATVKGLADRSPMKLLQTVEDAVAHYPKKDLTLLAQSFSKLRFSSPNGSADVARSLAGPPGMLALLDQARGEVWDYPALDKMAGDKTRARMFSTMLLGLLQIEGPSTGEVRTVRMEAPAIHRTWPLPLAIGFAFGAAAVEVAHLLLQH